ncbi:ankyrin repeat domain-containing protein [Tumebacillus sp. ITR2]|uniref:Ankyrin repeat domain-containing protein n=1 Tax=Tumebacillus amylolyticus TaxID=2801339 RepID=A0ABS1JD81_9BACL|nr:stalk domain-containing protein [Tumebacillus amylolyticus]MBL0388203.1 ankyrin repeat domain-containing protein [Tumebacillus amylolyticus]
MKRLGSFALVATLLLAPFPVAPQAAHAVDDVAPAISVKVDDQEQVYDPSPVLQNGRTMVPMRALFEKLGSTVEWDDATQTITAQSDTRKGQIKLKLQVGNPIAFVNDTPIELDQAPTMFGNYTMVPLRLVSESLRAAVIWDEQDHSIEVYSLNYQLFLSAIRGNVDLVTKELELGADPNYTKLDNGDTPLIGSALLMRLHVVELLLANGANINAQDNDGYSALIMAVSKQDLDMTKLLLDHGADPSLKSKEGTALDLARQFKNQPLIDLLQSQ